MSAEILRRAAALMRERAEAATTGAWEAMPGALGNPSDGPDHMRVVTEGWSGAYDADNTVARMEYEAQGGADAAHIASWHPAVALAVANWLTTEAAHYARYYPNGHRDGELDTASRQALDVARAYLGESA